MEMWKKIAWTPEQEQIIYREWGRFYTKKNKMDLADFFYNKSLELDPKDPKALYSRSQCKRSIAQTEGALVDALKALELDELRQPFNLEVCDGIYQLNEFERAKFTLSNYSRKFKGSKRVAFKNRIFVVNENFKASLGTELGYFILNHGKVFEKAYSKMQQERNNMDPRPMWKILKESEKCDILSILEIEKEAISPREVARRERSFRIFNQIYFGRNWIDVLFLKALQTDKNLLLPQAQLTRPMLENLTGSKYEVVQKMIKMLHARSPLYAETVRKCPDRDLKAKHREDYLFRVQYRVHRNMLHMLKTMRRLRQQRRVQKLRRYVEEIMGDYVVLKTRRLMPWKFEFTNEVYNLLGLALCDQYEIPLNMTELPREDRLMSVLQLQRDMDKDPVVYEFGKRHTFQDPDADDKNLILHKALVERLTVRLKFAKYPIEKAYLCHEIAASEFKQNSFDACCLFAERCIAEATKCNSFVWMLHGTMMICKAHAQFQKIEKVAENLRDAIGISSELKSARITDFLELCYNLSREEIYYKKRTDNLRIKSKQSLHDSWLSSKNRASVAVLDL